MQQPFRYPFTDATVVHIPGMLHGRHTSRLLIQVWSNDPAPKNLDLISTITIDPHTYDVRVTFQDLCFDPTIPLIYEGEPIPPQSGVVLISADPS